MVLWSCDSQQALRVFRSKRKIGKVRKKILVWFGFAVGPNEKILVSSEVLKKVDNFRALVGAKNDEVSAVRLRDNSISVC